jgi:hypothetical protein
MTHSAFSPLFSFAFSLLVSFTAHAAIPVVDDCAEARYLDRTSAGADRHLNWTYSFAGDPEQCIKIYAGQSVQWDGNFGDHPLDPDQGDTPNPVATHNNGLVTFAQPGIYGFRCNFHREMRGAIWVVSPPAVPVLGNTMQRVLMLMAAGVALFLLMGRRLSWLRNQT